MSKRASLAIRNTVVVSLPSPTPERLAEAMIVPLAKTVSAILFDGPENGSVGRLSASVDGAELAGPSLSTRLALRTGRQRWVLIVGCSARDLADRRITVSLGDALVAAIEPEWLQSPIVEPAELIDGLSEGGRIRLLKLFLTTGASLFGEDAAREFAGAAGRLLECMGVHALQPACWCRIGSSARLVTYRISSDIDLERAGDLVALTQGQPRRLSGHRLHIERTDEGGLLHLFLPASLSPETHLIGTGARPLHLRMPQGAPLVLAPWLDRRDRATRGWVHGIVETAAGHDPLARAVAEEMCWLKLATPSLEVAHLSSTPAGLLYGLRLDDPRDLVRGVRIERGEHGVEIEADMQPGAGTKEIMGYARLPRHSRMDDGVRVHLLYRSGRSALVSEVAPAFFDGALPTAMGRPLRDVAAGAVARARLDRARPAPYYGIESWGCAEAPSVSVVVPVSVNLDVVRVRASLVASEAAGRSVEIIYAVAADKAPAVRAAILQAHAVHGVPHRLVVCAADVDPCTRLRVAVAVAGGGIVMVLGADVLPTGRGWLDQAADTRGACLAALPLADHHGAALSVSPIGAVGMAEGIVLRRPAADAFALADVNYPEADVVLAHLARALGVSQAQDGTVMSFVRYAETRINIAEAQVAAAALRVLDAGDPALSQGD